MTLKRFGKKYGRLPRGENYRYNIKPKETGGQMSMPLKKVIKLKGVENMRFSSIDEVLKYLNEVYYGRRKKIS